MAATAPRTSTQPATQGDLHAMETRLGQGIDGMETRLGGVETRLDGVETELKSLDNQVGDLRETMEGTNSGIATLTRILEKQYGPEQP